jgi:hypothetical protein
MSDFDDARQRSRRLMAASPLAIPLQRALQNIAKRRATLLQPQATPPADFAAPEPLPIIGDSEAFAKDFFRRLMTQQRHSEKNKQAPQATSPRLVGSNDNDPQRPGK